MSFPYQIKSFEAYENAYKKSVKNPEEFWAEIASNFIWKQPWNKVLEWDFKDYYARWFIGGKLNITENCLDRHLATNANMPAIIWEPNNPVDHHRILTYR